MKNNAGLIIIVVVAAAAGLLWYLAKNPKTSATFNFFGKDPKPADTEKTCATGEYWNSVSDTCVKKTT